jgi:hypothetical protein
MIILYATRPEYTERRIRNDRLEYVHTSARRCVDLAQRTLSAWQQIEPHTKFELVFSGKHLEIYNAQRIDLVNNMR